MHQAKDQQINISSIALKLMIIAVLVVVAFVAQRLVRVDLAYDDHFAAQHNLRRVNDYWESYRSQHGHYPESFDQLLRDPNLHPELCKDPFSPAKSDYYKVLRNDGKVYIYSVGPDGTDDKLNKLVTNIDWQISGDVTTLSSDRVSKTLHPVPLSAPD